MHQFLEQANFSKKKQVDKKENIYSDIDEMLSSTLKTDET